MKGNKRSPEDMDPDRVAQAVAMMIGEDCHALLSIFASFSVASLLFVSSQMLAGILFFSIVALGNIVPVLS